MLRTTRVTLLAILAGALSACATLVGGGTNQGVSVTSQPSGASFTVKAASGMQMASGTTPQTVILPRKHDYQIEFTVPGYRPQSMPLTKGINGWVYGNFIFGWIPGFIIDFISGSAHKLEPALVQISLQRSTAESGAEVLFGVVRQLDAKGRVMSEQKVELQPVE